MPDGLELLELSDAGDGRFDAPMPAGSPEDRDVIFGGQILAQSIMAACANAADPKIIKSIHTIFARAGTYSQPLHYQVTQVHDGRTFGSKTITAYQGERMLATSIVLMTAGEEDLIAHGITMPQVPGPLASAAPEQGSAFPGSQMRVATTPNLVANGVPTMSFWARLPDSLSSEPASQAVLAWTTNAPIIGLAMEAHPDAVSLEAAHHTLSTGVIAHTMHFHRAFDAGSWLLVSQEATFAGRGRVHGRGAIFDEAGSLVATYAQDSMVKAVDAAAVGLGTRSRM